MAREYIECERMAKVEREGNAEDVELQRRQIPRAQQNGQSYRHSLVTISSSCSTTVDDDDALSKSTKDCPVEISSSCCIQLKDRLEA